MGEVSRTIEVSRSLADSRRRIQAVLEFSSAGDESVQKGGTVSRRELSIPEAAAREYREAEERLGRRDSEGALERLGRAVKRAPQFAEALNMMGTIYYQTHRFPEAEASFREALRQDPEGYPQLVNLGGVLVTTLRPDEALLYNLHAALRRPGDALANAQLGMNYLLLGRLGLAEKFLATAKKLDAGHFSAPQLSLAEVYLRRKEPGRAAAEYEEYLKYHPDSPRAGELRERIRALQKPVSLNCEK
jgi:Tfp pilus assembly protein PilF